MSSFSCFPPKLLIESLPFRFFNKDRSEDNVGFGFVELNAVFVVSGLTCFGSSNLAVDVLTLVGVFFMSWAFSSISETT